MELLLGIAVFVVLVIQFRGPRLRAWVVGIALVGVGFAVHAAFEVWVDDRADRAEMAAFAVVEGTLFLAGLACLFVDLQGPWPPGFPVLEKGSAWVLWLVAVVVAAWAVLDRLPS